MSNNRSYIRATVSRLTDSHIIAASVNGKELRVPFIPNSGNDLGYLKPYLKKGSQLNLVNIREGADGELQPELVIYEPDYLLDITGVAECFESYGASPEVSLVKRIKPETVTRHILLGGFAGQLLDEAVRSDGNITASYSTLATNFFRSNAVRIAVCDDLDADFHENVRSQQSNIEKAVSVSMRNIPDYDADKIILEPSFFCEMLGLQGRMDLMQTDFTVLMEQKSGKGDMGSSDFGKPRHRRPHLVQLLLYRAVLHYGFNIPDADINSYLLYSRYPEPLLPEQPLPGLLHEAIKMRNLLVCQELEIAFGSGIERLAMLTPDSFHSPAVSPRFWNDYVKPDLEQTLSPLMVADPIARAYALRLFRFVALEQFYSKTGNLTNGTTDGFAGAWKATLEEKITAGNIMHGLDIAELISDGDNAIEGLVLCKADEDNEGEMPNFRTGDIVVLYPYQCDRTPDLRAGIVIRCSITAIDNDRITVKLRAPQTNTAFFAQRRNQSWAMEHDVMDSSFKSLWRNINTFLSAPPERKELILGTRLPKVNPSHEISGDYGSFNTLVQNAMRASEQYIIIGPPGTGKTSHGLMNIVLEELKNEASSVLLGAYTNRAVDEICCKLTEAGIDFIRLGTSAGCSELYAQNMIGARVNQCNNIGMVKKLLSEARVIVGTTQSLTANISLFRLRGFSLAIIDEASQILEPHIIGLLSATHNNSPAIKRYVLIGDHKQLPAVVKQTAEEAAVDDNLLETVGFTNCRMSFFERQLHVIRKQNNGNLPQEYVYTLTNQGRMHSGVANIASTFFYEGMLGTVPLPHQEAEVPQIDIQHEYVDPLNRHRNIFLNVEPEQPVTSDNANRREAAAIARMVHAIYLREEAVFSPEKTVGVIVPYRNQISAVKKAVAALAIPQLNSISVDTVERFQGSQREYIIYGFTIKRPDQFPFMTATRFTENGVLIDRKLNVALTRSRSHNILVGNAKLLQRDSLYSSLIDAFRSNGIFIDCLPEDLPELPPSY